MLTLPDSIMPILQPFSTLFQQRTWVKAQVLLIGAVLAPRKRTVTSALRVMGLSDDDGFAKHHHVLNRATWSSLRLSHVLLLLLIQRFDRGVGPLVFGIDETIERRRGIRIKAKGIYRDGARSSRSHFAKASGLRWISLMWLADIPWARRTWALPVLTALAPSERYCQKMGRSHKKITDWARQMILQLRRWLPNSPIVVVADSGYVALDLLHFRQSMAKPVTLITRLRLDAALYEPAPARLPGQMGRPRLKGQRLPHAQKNSSTAPTHAGPGHRSHGAITIPGRWNSALTPRSGITPASRLCQFDGISFETLSGSSTPRRFSAPIFRYPRHRSSNGSLCAKGSR